MIIAASLLIALVSFGLYFRYLYLLYMSDAWEQACAMYVVLNNENQYQMARYIETWPRWRMVLEVLQWDYSAFIVDQAAMKKVLDFLIARVKIVGQ